MAAAQLPLAHLGHWLWVLYLIPIVVVLGGIAYSTWTGRRREGR